MDWNDLEGFLAVDRDLSAATVAGLMRQSRTLRNKGFRWDYFTSSPDAAKREARTRVKAYKAAGQLHAARLTCRLLNHVAGYLALHDERWQLVHWDLPAVPDNAMDPYDHVDLAALEAYRHANPFVEARRRAMGYLAKYCSPRRGAIVAMQTRHLHQDPPSAMVRRPGKRGHAHQVPLPRDAFRPRGELATWLQLRLEHHPITDALWISSDGVGLTHAGWGRELEEMSQALGFRVNFNRFRHSRAVLYDECDMPAQRAQDLFGWTSTRPFDHYRHGNVERTRRTLEKLGVPGYEAQPV